MESQTGNGLSFSESMQACNAALMIVGLTCDRLSFLNS
ncbi:hypothetical protein HCH_03955 [Hahella chejuensis KCTC 2396]|uniref:Uncharacterized protein n=1 Tax=Hahella chejuensis (strain KCTC 2396) TaxID=349521 RepID=Q2SFA0_HAHCH|nr:hypothetical protein HCH_03955 [Hahella chejuensis KCTC 2396]